MKEPERGKRTSALVWGILVLAVGCVGFVLSKKWLFLIAGVAGFALITTLGK